MPRRYSMRTRQLASDGVRNRILEATLDELGAAGGEIITLQAVAARADVALRTVYNHFAGREELLAAAFVHHARQTRADIDALTVPEAGPEEQLQHVVAAYYARYARMGPRLGALLSLRGFPELDEHIRSVRAWRRDLLADILERAHRNGELAIPRRVGVALAFTLTSHAGWHSLLESLDDDPDETTRVANQALASALFHG
jgi:AcrR family transcriptional regulator